MNGDESLAVNVMQGKLLYDTVFCGNMSSLKRVLRKLRNLVGKTQAGAMMTAGQ